MTDKTKKVSLPEPKKVSKVGRFSSLDGRNATTSRSECDRIKQSDKQSDVNNLSDSAPRRKRNLRKRGLKERMEANGLSAAEAAQQASDRWRERKEEKSNRAIRKLKSGTYPKLEEVNSLWFTVYESITGNVPTSGATKKEWAIFRSATKRNPVIDLPEFFANVCTQWNDLRSGDLKWVNNFPESPEFKFLCYMVRHFRTALDSPERFMERQRGKLTGTDVINAGGLANRTLREFREVVDGSTSSVEELTDAFRRLGSLSPLTEPLVLEAAGLVDGVHERVDEEYSLQSIGPTVYIDLTGSEIEDSLSVDIGDYQMCSTGPGALSYQLFIYGGMSAGWITTLVYFTKEFVNGSSTEQILDEIRRVTNGG